MVQVSPSLLVASSLCVFYAALAGSVCFRKYDEGTGACKGRITNRLFTSTESCCDKHGQGHSAELIHIEHRKKWFECTPCVTSHEAPPSDRLMKMDSDVRHKQPDSLERHRDDEVEEKNRTNEDFNSSVTSENSTDVIEWSEWSDWGPCSKTCGEGRQKRRRYCMTVFCPEQFEERACEDVHSCPVHGGWSLWDDWKPCSATCGNGTQTRSRTCSNPPATHGGLNCDGMSVDLQQCDIPPCPVDGDWTHWSGWSSCSLTCGHGEQLRTRTCSNPAPAHGGDKCDGQSNQAKPCHNIPCPIDGGWSGWTSWTNCSASCGEGTQRRTRNCNDPVPEHGGQPCEGLQQETTPCVTRINCPVDGNWSEWSRWDICSAKPCSGQRGHRIRYRTCTNPQPMFGGRTCKGKTWTRQHCYNNEFCAGRVDGGWCEWMEWSRCTSDIQLRSRVCQCPPPTNGGTPCSGREVEENACISPDVSSEVPSDLEPEVQPNEDDLTKQDHKENVDQTRKETSHGKGCASEGSGDGSDVTCDEEQPEMPNADDVSSGGRNV